MQQQEPSVAQAKLFELMADFAASTVRDSLSCGYNILGTMIFSDSAAQMILPVLENYFNLVAACICNRGDKFIDQKFDEMAACGIDYNRLDMLNMIVIMTLNIVREMDVTLRDGSLPNMHITHEHLRSIATSHRHLASSLTRCRNSDGIHVNHGERIYTFSVDKIVHTENGPVKLTRL